MSIANQAEEPGVNYNDYHKKGKNHFKILSLQNDNKPCPDYLNYLNLTKDLFCAYLGKRSWMEIK